MKRIFISVSILMVNITSIFAQSNPKVSINDLRNLVGNWTGTLTYLDYSSNKPYTMPADIEIRQAGNTKSFIFFNIYPNEPKANSFDTISISKNGRMLNKEVVKGKSKLANGDLEITTEFSSIDGNDDKPATIRITYTFGGRKYKNVKEVQFAGQDKWIKRHEYSYTRK